ncbi:MAG: histidine phosphatase family protein, partial [Bryobacteraceae bacterium]
LGRTDVALRLDTLPAIALPVASVFASPLRRARRTAALLFPFREMTILDGLAERDLGEWDGLSWEAVQHGWPDLARQAEFDWLGTTPPKGESWPTLIARVTPAFHQMCRAEKPIAVVAHVGVNAALAELIAGRNPMEFRQDYLEVLTLELES